MEVAKCEAYGEVQTDRKISCPSLEPLEGMVICPIDLNLLDDPRLLPCGHAFCCECLTNYMNQLSSSRGGQNDVHGDLDTAFACPICRMACTMPPSMNANCFPKAFNHLVILDFLRKNQLSLLKSTSNNQLSGTMTETNNTQSRKTSIQVNSQMLNYIVTDIAARERDGKISPADRAVIMDEVTALLEKLNGPDASKISPNNRTAKHQAMGTGKRSVCSSSSNGSPTGSAKHLDRFNAFAAKVKGTRRASKTIEIHPDTPSYTTYRDAENVRLTMKGNAKYTVLNKGKNCCIMRLGEIEQPVDMRFIMMPDSSQLWRQTVTTDTERTKLIMWCQPIDVETGVFFNTTVKPLIEISGPLEIQGYGLLKVNYIRYFGDCFYVSGTVPEQVVGLYPTLPESDVPELNEIGLVVCCSTTALEKLINKDKGARDSPNPFIVQSVSCAFRRDSVGSQRLDLPVVFGIDVDQSTGAIYVAQPANAMISRIRMTDLTHVDGTWYLNDPQLSPHFLCFAETSRQIWATCPREEKVAILDLETDGFHHFSPHASFGISPSHIIYTSDERIILLDQLQSRMYWITKVHQTICVQCLDVQFTSRLRRQFMVIQPMCDRAMSMLSRSIRDKTSPLGGILCAHDFGCSILYPTRYSGRLRLRTMNCSSLCGP